MTSQESTVQSKREPRVEVEVKGASLRERGGKGIAIVIRDLSLNGFSTEWPYKIRAGAQVWLTLPGLSARLATVAWARDYRIGCRFDEPLHPAVVDRIVQAARA